MRVFFPIFFSIVAIGVLSLAEIFLLRKLHPDWWKRTWVRTMSASVPVVGLVSLLLWSLGILVESAVLENIGAYGSAIISVVGIALMLSLPFSALVHWTDSLLYRVRRHVKARRDPDQPTLVERRKILKTSAVAFPALALTGGGIGISDSLRDPEIREIELKYPNLPLGLDGLRVLHISDVHIGLFLGLDDLDRMVERSSRLNPDVVLVTGDFSDDVDLYFDALKIVHQIPATHGTFASIGNHEYFRGIREIRHAYDLSPVPLLLNEGTSLAVNGNELYIAGADDPRTLKRSTDAFFAQTIDTAMRDAHSNAFVILMSHRPEGFDQAAHVGIDLTLAGHTHGGQIGYNGRSLFEAVYPGKYMWGLYENGASKLYTSAGAGHWFPYRLGCPAEIPVYTLKRT